MADFSFLKNLLTKKWVVLAPRRAKKPDIAKGTEPSCPFCPGKENGEEEIYRVGGRKGDSNWELKIIPNKFPFTPIHELIIETPDHHTTFSDFTKDRIKMIIETYKHRYNEHSSKGQVYIFHNHGEKGGESVPHSHTQVTVVPDQVLLEVPRLITVIPRSFLDLNTHRKKSLNKIQDNRHDDLLLTKHFVIFCPEFSVWPDEVWVAPQKSGRVFGEISDQEVLDMADILGRLIKIFDLRYNKDFPYNFYIYPGGDWYLRIVPRLKMPGGFEVGTNVFVNTQRSQETMGFIKEHFDKPNLDKILREQQAEYHYRV